MKSHRPVVGGLMLALHACVLVTGFSFASSAEAMIINEQKFRQWGGDPNNIDGTIARAFDAANKRSYASPFEVVGHIDGCTATWLGEDQQYSYILTAAHCLESDLSGGPAVRVNRRFVSGDGTVIAQGQGWRYLHPYRLSIPAGFGGASTDIGLLKLPRLATPKDANGKPVTSPLLYDGADELNREVHFAGYGTWGVGVKTGPWWPSQGERRLWGSSVIDGIWESDHGIGAGYEPTKETNQWTRLASGDSGSAWWQQQGGYWTIIATTNGYGSGSTGARVSKFVSWIKGLTPPATSLTDRMTVTESRPFVSRNHAEDVKVGTVSYLIPGGQADISGPAAPVWRLDQAYSVIKVKARDEITGATAVVSLRGQRDNGCWKAGMEEAMICYDFKQGPLTVSFNAQDNPNLPSGHWKANFDAEAVGWHQNTYRQRFRVNVDLHHLTRARVTATVPFKSVNFAAQAKLGTVSYVVPVQPGASGPMQATWGTSSGQLSRITVKTQDALTLKTQNVVLRAARNNACWWANMEDAQICYDSKEGPLLVWFEAADNPTLPAGIYHGKVYVQARGWHDASLREGIEIDVDLDTVK